MAAEALITTVIPTYRRPALLERAITSVLRQTYPRLRVCVYDNASGDETAGVVARLARDDPRVHYHCHPENIGMTANFSYALDDIETPYFSILADDDYLLPGFFATAMQGFAEHPDAMLSAGSVVSMTEDGQVTHVSMNLWERDGYFPSPEGLFEWTIPRHPDITGLLFRSDVLDLVGSLDPTLLNADYDLEWRIISRYPYVVSKEPCVVSVVHETQATRTSDAAAWIASYRTMRAHLGANEVLSAYVRTRAQTLLASTFADAMLVVGLAALRDRNFDIAHGAARALGLEFGRRREGRALELLTRACERARPLHRGVVGAYDLLLATRRWRTRELKQQIDGVLGPLPGQSANARG